MYEFLPYRLDNVMTRKPVTITPETSLREAEQIFEEHDFNGLPVVENGENLVGWLTKLDLLSAFCGDDEHLFMPYAEIMQRDASSVMSRKVRSVTPLAPLTRVLEKLVTSGNKSFPVLDDGRIVGVVAREDILRGLRRAAEGIPPGP